MLIGSVVVVVVVVVVSGNCSTHLNTWTNGFFEYHLRYQMVSIVFSICTICYDNAPFYMPEFWSNRSMIQINWNFLVLHLLQKTDSSLPVRSAGMNGRAKSNHILPWFIQAFGMNGTDVRSISHETSI